MSLCGLGFSRATPSCIALVFVILASFSLVHGKYDAGELDTNSHFHFLSKFCFSDDGIGHLKYKVWNGPKDLRGISLSFFDDQAGSWDDAKKHKHNCTKVREIADRNVDLLNDVPGKVKFHDPSEPHYWYVAATRCNDSIGVEDKGIKIKFQLTFTNPGGFFYEQFSYEDQGFLAIYMTIFFAYLFFFSLHMIGVCVIWRGGQLTMLNRIFTLALFCNFIGFGGLWLHNIIYAADGLGAPGIEGFGEILLMASSLLFMALLLLLAKGWKIITPVLTGVKVMIVLFAVFLLTYVAFFIWQNVTVEEVDTLYVYESPPGVVVLVLRGGTWVMFLVFLLVSTVKIRGDRVKEIIMYFVLLPLGTIWFFGLPFLVIIGRAIREYDRAKVVTGVWISINFAIEVLMALWFAARAVKVFRDLRSGRLEPPPFWSRFTFSPLEQETAAVTENLVEVERDVTTEGTPLKPMGLTQHEKPYDDDDGGQPRNLENYNTL